MTCEENCLPVHLLFLMSADTYLCKFIPKTKRCIGNMFSDVESKSRVSVAESTWIRWKQSVSARSRGCALHPEGITIIIRSAGEPYKPYINPVSSSSG